MTAHDQQETSPLSLRVAVVDYDAGNLLSVTRALAAVGVEAFLAPDAASVLSGDAVILPGVGAAGDAMRALRERKLVEPIHAAVASGRAFMGVCLGQQLLFDSSDEDGGVACLGLLPGGCHKFPAGRKVPHMGWNNVTFRYDHPLVTGIPDGAQFYFVHSYYVQPRDDATVLGTTDYSVTFSSIVAHENVLGVQFHPEKSSTNGLQLYRNFAAFADSLRFNAPPFAPMRHNV
ncbi:MAG: imidazole glycerol phosphate synthase subunit HisH [Chloroflexota bacterium]